MAYFLGVDVGTGSARSGVFDEAGHMLASATCPIDTWRPMEGFAQQSSGQIWGAVSASVREAIKVAEVPVAEVQGIGFDATCSLVLVDAEGGAVTVSPDGDPQQDVILWADHRAVEIAREIDRSDHPLLQVSGGTISPEMQLPKLAWLKRHLPESWGRTAHFFDLPDWLTWRATAATTRSQCSLVCKWAYRGTGEGWDKGFFDVIGLGDLAEEGFSRIGVEVAKPGEFLGTLSERAAAELGLSPQTKVGVSMIDAHAGALGSLGAGGAETRMALIAGTSACHITTGPDAAYVPGVWGPYFGVIYPDLWVSEAGQSMAGAAIDTVLHRHTAWEALVADALRSDTTPYALLEQRLGVLAQGRPIAELTRDRHVLPEFSGNRSPLADPTRLGVTSGQKPVPDRDDLALDYLASVQSLAYGSRQILEQLRAHSVAPAEIIVSGGLAKNGLYCQTHADVCACPVVIPDQDEPVLLGAAMLGASAAGAASLARASSAMCGAGRRLVPNPERAAYHDRKFACFKAMQVHFAELRSLMTPEDDYDRA